METAKTPLSHTTQLENKELAAAYVRVSTTKQKETGYSIEVQTELAKKYAVQHGWLLKDDLIFQEDKSASKIESREINKENLLDSFTNRPELLELMKKAQKENIQHLIIHTRDRLSRSLEETIILNAYFERYKIDIHYTQEGQNLNNEDEKINRLLHVILTSIAELESNVLSTRVKEGNKACLSKGWWPGGKAPLGYYRKSEFDSATKKHHSFLVKSNFESNIIKRIFYYYEKGLGYVRIAEKMNEEFGYIKWTKSKIESIIKNQTYTGQIAWDRRGGRRNSKKHDTISLSALKEDNIIINKAAWDSINIDRKQRAELKDAFYYNTPFIFKGKLICSKCGRLMKPRNPGIKKTNVYKCASTPGERAQCNCIIPAHIIENYFTKYMDNIFKVNDYECFWNTYNSTFDKKILEYKGLIPYINDNIIELNKTINSLEIRISQEDNREIKTALKTQYIAFSKIKNNYELTKKLIEEKVNVPKLTKEHLIFLVKSCLSSTSTDANASSLPSFNKTNLNLRAFINLFVDEIIVDYNSENKAVDFLKITFIPAEFI